MMLGKLLLLPFVGPIKGLVEIARKVQEIADQELNGPAAVKERLAQIQLDLELGRISEEVYRQEEEALLKLLEQAQNETGREPDEEGD
jgi:hypothetical protein